MVFINYTSVVPVALLYFTHLYSANSPMSGLLGAAIPLFIGALWGVGDGVLNTQLSALLGLLFEDVKVILFSACI